MTSLSYESSLSQPLKGVIYVPGDKSISHRALMFASIAEGTSTINGFLDGDDCLATLEAFRKMGVRIEGPYDGRVIVHGVGKYGLKAPESVIDCGNSGTTMRLLTGLLAGQAFNSTLTGDASLVKRPMLRVSRPLTQMGAEIITVDGHAPIEIHGNKTLYGIDYDMPQASAQVKSCLLLAGMYAEGETLVHEPGITRDHTERMLTAFSYPVHKFESTVGINANGQCQATDVIVPCDISSAAFFIVAASIVPGSEITIRNVGVNPTRIGILHILEKMGANIELHNRRLCGEEPVADLHVRYAPLEGIDIPSHLVPMAIDEFPAVFIAAACASGQTLLHGAEELRHKESDRIAVMVEGLVQIGIDAHAFEDGLYIQGGQIKGGVVNSYHDHRIAMAFSIAGAVAKSPVVIKDCEAVRTSFPGFVQKAQEVSMNIKEILSDVG